MAEPDASPTRGGQLLGRLAHDLLAEERTNKASLEARAIGVIATVGSLVTVLFALAALVTGRPGFVLPAAARCLLAGALAGLLTASVTAIFVNLPYGHLELKADDLLRRINSDDDWNAPAEEVEHAMARVLAVQLVSARHVSRLKARLLAYAVLAEVIGVTFIAAAISVILLLNPA